MNELQQKQAASQQAAAQQAAQQAAFRKQALDAQNNNKGLYKKIGIAVAALLVVAALLFVYQTVFSANGIKKNQYQAVFLTNGQVYFGKLSDPESPYLNLDDVYYLQVQENNEEGSQNPQNPSNQKPTAEPQLIKLGEELHGPEDQMKISKDQITFWENLKDDSKVVQAIKANQNK